MKHLKIFVFSIPPDRVVIIAPDYIRAERLLKQRYGEAYGAGRSYMEHDIKEGIL